MSNKVILPLYDDNGMELEKHIVIDAGFFLADQGYNGRVVETPSLVKEMTSEGAESDAPEEAPVKEADNENIRIGWYEFIRLPSATTHIVYVGESSLYVPEDGVDPMDFFNAVDRGQAYRLVREADVRS
jgi:hypothetical protein